MSRRKAQPVNNTAYRRLFLFVKMEIKHFYCVLYWAPVKAAVQADVTGKVLMKKPFLSLAVHTRVDTQVEELDIHVNVYIPLFFS